MNLESATASGGAVELVWSDGARRRLHPLWLRDNVSDVRHPQTNQRVRRVLDLPDECAVVAAALTGDGLTINWADGAAATFDLRWLAEHARPAPARIRRTWDATLAVPEASWASAQTDAGAEPFLDGLAETGLALLRGVPVERGMVARVAERFGFVRDTNYGRIFDVEAVPNAEHLAYTGVGLALHTDNPYRAPTPGYQLLHCLQSDAAGGESTFVDGFHAAEVLRALDPAAFETLCTTEIAWRYRDSGADLRDRKPTFVRDAAGQVVRVYFNDRSMSPLDLDFEQTGAFYSAFRALSRVVDDPANVLRLRLEPGDLVVFDNERALHGRAPFDLQKGRRLLQGCYADRDAFDSFRRVLGGR